ncbi:histidine kinase [Chitinophaga pendula]|uniref:sensor histidine kinase n=1 Tax=Chitinophaga TaxID=79328 RepID=UPI000BAEB4DE|nr:MULTISPECIES: histidine kinase [Chitinophaga]ASZ10293.1 hypothetical protein CK934_04505 [Chitinophaga sp. MD30]UCJ06745.1 histidine kinase [Chitinophaga pendula]
MIRYKAAREITLRQTLADLERHAFQAQLDPHFIFNSLNAIHHYILTTSTELASLYLTRFSRLMRMMIGNFNKEWITLQDDLEALELYLQLEQLRFEPQFHYEVLIEPEVCAQFTLVPPLIIQPYVQEAIWRHILRRPQKQGGLLRIIIDKEEEALVILVEDNGVAATGAAPEGASYHPDSVLIAAERLQMMSGRYHLEATVNAIPTYDETERHCGNKTRICMQHMISRQSMAV